MSIRPPTEAEIEKLSSQLYLDLTEQEIQDYCDLVSDLLDSYEAVGRLGQAASDRPEHQSRDPGYRVQEADPYNAWITRCDIAGREDGPLAGWEIGIKDNISVGGVEMTCGSQVVEGYVPDTDATLVSRLLNAGGRVVGKTNMDDMAFTGNGHSGAFGPTLNPHDREYLSGGSSGGSAIAVATGEVDLAIGSDQGGSVRVPAAWSGIVGHKPTHGLVPYTGCVGIENTIDHAGPLAPNVESAAKALSVIAGRDPDDPRQPQSVPDRKYEQAIDEDIQGLSIGIVEEGFTQPGHDPSVNESVHSAIDTLRQEGATAEKVSVPLHADAADVYTVALAEGFLAAFSGEGIGHNWTGRYDTSWVDSFGKARRSQGEHFPPSVKLTLLAGAYTSDQYHSKYYAEAMNLRAELTQQYEELLSRYDIVAMPTTATTANKYVSDQDRFEFMADAWGCLANTSVFNMTGHPSLSVPVAPVDGLPAGIMLTGQQFDDATALKAGHVLEQAQD